MTEHDHSLRSRTFLDDQKMCILYEKFILEYFKKHYKDFQVTASFINWRTDDGMIDFLPQMRPDVMIRYENTTLVLDAKYYEKSMQGNQFTDKKTVHSNNLYQIFTYVKNKDVNQDGSVMGMLLYAKTDEEIIPHEKYEMSGNKIYIRTLDLNVKFDAIKEQLDEIAKLVVEKGTKQ